MSETIGAAQVELGVDSSGVDAGVARAKKSIATLGDGAAKAGKDAAQGIDLIGKSGDDSAQKIDAATKRTIASIERQTLAMGKTRSEYYAAQAAIAGNTSALAPYIAKMGEAEKAAERMAKMQQMAARAGAAIGLAMAAAATAAVLSIRSIVNTADALNDMSQRLGIGVGQLASYTLAAEQSGTSMEAIAKGVKGLASNMVEHGAAMKSAGITAKDADGAMRQIADLFSKMPDGIEKTNLAVKLFGKSGMDLIPMLNLGSKGLNEAAEKSAKYAAMMALLAPQADKFNDSVAELAMYSKLGGMALVNDMLPGLIQITAAMNEAAKSGSLLKTLWVGLGGLGTALFTDEFADAAQKIINLKGELGSLERHREQLTPGHGGFLQKWLYGSADEMDAKIAATKKQITDLQAQMSKPPSESNKPQTGLPDLKDWFAQYKKLKDALGTEGSKSDYDSFNKRLQVALAPQDADGKQTRAAKLQIELDLDRTITSKEREKLQLLINQVAAQDAITASKKSEQQGRQVLIGLEKNYQSELEKRKDALAAPLLSISERVLADDMRSVAKSAQDSRIELEKLHVSGSLSAADYSRLLQQVTADEAAQKISIKGLTDEQDRLNGSWKYGADVALRNYIDEISNVAKQTESMMTRAFKGMEDALVQFVRTGKMDFKSLADSIINDLIRIQIQQSIMKPISDAFQSAGGFSGLIGKIFGSGSGSSGGGYESGVNMAYPSANGNVFSGPGISAYSGSVVNKPTLFPFARGTGLMGEAGPEAILPLTRINGKLGVQALGGGNAAPNVVINLSNQSGQNVNAKQQGGPQFNGSDWVIGVVLEAADNNPHFRNAMGMGR